MGYLNAVTILGRIGQDLELRAVSDTHVVEFSVATTEKWKDKSGNDQEFTEWSKVVFWGKKAETIARFFKKGSQILVKGSLKTEEWQDKDSNKRFTTKIKGSQFVFIDKLESGGGQQQPASGGNNHQEDDVPF